MRTVITPPEIRNRGQAPAPACQTYTVDEAARLLGISRSHAYACVKSGELPGIRFRGRIVIPKQSVWRVIDAPAS